MLVSADVQELLSALVADLDSVAAALELAAERPHELALGVKHEDRRVPLQIRATLVNHVQVADFVDRYIVRRLPRVFFWQLRPVVHHLKPMLALAHHDLLGL